jgi:hypothetical protein
VKLALHGVHPKKFSKTLTMGKPFCRFAAIIATMDAIQTTHRFARRTGWSATSDGLRIYFSA